MKLSRVRQKNLRDILPDTLDIADFGLSTKLAFGSDFSGDLLDFGGENSQLVDHRVDGVDQVKHLSRDRDTGDLAGQVTASDGSLQNG